MWKKLKESKKAMVALACMGIAVVCVVLRHLGVPISAEEIAIVQAPLGLYILGQGIADHGKPST